MAENDFPGIRPLDSLQTIRSMDPVESHKESKKRQGNPEENQQETSQAAEQDKTASSDSAKPSDNEHSIDYCA